MFVHQHKAALIKDAYHSFYALSLDEARGIVLGAGANYGQPYGDGPSSRRRLFQGNSTRKLIGD